jgi:dipeptidyl aminopeptidase/acylaminoacyl peptidase
MTQAREVLPYGSWPSPISAADVAKGGIRLGFPMLVPRLPWQVGVDEEPDVWWVEGRPAEGGRQVIVSAEWGDLLPAPWNARTRVHEYGGSCCLPLPSTHYQSTFVFSEWSDQRLYHHGMSSATSELSPTGPTTTRTLTPEPAAPGALRYADLVLSPDGSEVWCIREEHHSESPSDVTRAIVGVPLDGSAADDPAKIRIIVSGSQFLAYPTPSPDGEKLAWIAWNHPDMPWDSTELRVGDLTAGSVGEWRTVLGGDHESVLEPRWADSAHLYAVSDTSGWWNLYRVDASGIKPPTPVARRDEEFAGPLWQLGYHHYDLLDDGRLVVLHGGGTQKLGILDPTTGRQDDVELPYTTWHPSIDVHGKYLVGVAGSAVRPNTVVRVDLQSSEYVELRHAVDDLPAEEYLPQPYTATFTGPSGRDVHAHVYAPHNPLAQAPDDERPPFIVFVHGGPTSSSPPSLDLEYAYFTSRGIGVIDVEYGGSTGYGREYRERLRGQWGVVDVEDCVAAVHALAENGQADAARLAIRGGSAGGWTTLAALTRTTAFAAGTSYFGVAELLKFAHDTHDFESRYIDGLIGPLPAAHDLYVERAPLSHVNEISCPVLLLQGLEDKVVPPSQAEMFRDALVAKGIRHAYIAFEGEQHGFRKAETVIASLEAELSFYGQVFGFTPPGIPLLQLS